MRSALKSNTGDITDTVLMGDWFQDPPRETKFHIVQIYKQDAASADNLGIALQGILSNLKNARGTESPTSLVSMGPVWARAAKMMSCPKHPPWGLPSLE